MSDQQKNFDKIRNAVNLLGITNSKYNKICEEENMILIDCCNTLLKTFTKVAEKTDDASYSASTISSVILSILSPFPIFLQKNFLNNIILVLDNIELLQPEEVSKNG